MLNLLLIHDHSMLGEGLAQILNSQADLALVAHCAAFQEAYPLLENGPIDLVLLDGSQETGGIGGFIREVRFRGFGGAIVAISTADAIPSPENLIQMGASAIVLKTSPASFLLKVVRQSAATGYSFPRFDHRHAAEGAGPLEPPGLPSLNDRERRVVRFVTEGLTNKEIAARLALSESLVKFTLQRIFAKTGVHSRTQLVRISTARAAATAASGGAGA